MTKTILVRGFIYTSFTIAILLSGCHNRPKAPEHLRILFTSDTQGNFTPCGCAGGPRGGMERRLTAIKQAREEFNGPVILVDTGNFTTGLETNLERIKADYVVQAMSLMNYDAVNVGRMDARRPRLAVSKFNQPDKGFPLTSAAFTYTTSESPEPLFSYPSRVIVQRDGFRIGIIGHTMDDLSDEKLGIENQVIDDPYRLIALIDEVLIKDNAQMVILLTDYAGPFIDATFRAARFKLASVIITGESAPPQLTQEAYNKDVSHPLIVPRAGSWGRTLGVLDLNLSRSGGIIGYKLRYIDLNEKIPKDPALASLTEEYLAKINEGPRGVPSIRTAGYIGSASCKPCHGDIYESWLKTDHASAWATLEDSGRLNEAACVPCHTTGYEQTEAFPARMVPYEMRNVGCESCHGPGEVHLNYRKYKIYGELTGKPREKGLSDPIVRMPPESTCIKCHIEPYDEGWRYAVKLDRISHK